MSTTIPEGYRILREGEAYRANDLFFSTLHPGPEPMNWGFVSSLSNIDYTNSSMAWRNFFARKIQQDIPFWGWFQK